MMDGAPSARVKRVAAAAGDGAQVVASVHLYLACMTEASSVRAMQAAQR